MCVNIGLALWGQVVNFWKSFKSFYQRTLTHLQYTYFYIHMTIHLYKSNINLSYIRLFSKLLYVKC